MLQPKSVKQIEKAKNIADKAINVFTSTVDELTSSSDVLTTVILREEEVIKECQARIDIAKSHIGNNSTMISKLKEFTNL